MSLMQPRSGAEYLQSEFGMGVIHAFPQMVRAIFGEKAVVPPEDVFKAAAGAHSRDNGGKLSATVRRQEEGEEEVVSAGAAGEDDAADTAAAAAAAAEEDPPPDLADFFEENLRELYYGALAAAKKADREVVYRLDALELVEPVDVRTFIGTSRLKAAAELPNPAVKRMLGFTVVEGRQLPVGPDGRPRVEHVTVQVDVDVTCQELFMVKDKPTGVILQGAEALGTVVHRLTLEAVFLPGEGWRMLEDWLVVDVDGWLEGNPFV